MLRPGDRVAGRYRLEVQVRSAARSALADGSGAPVPCSSPAGLWRATDEVLARTVAVKVLCSGEPGSAADPRAGEPFLQAAVAAGRLTGPVLARVYDAAAESWPTAAAAEGDSATGRLAYVVREWVDGRDLATVLHEDGPFEPAAACRLAAVIAEALDAAHSQGVVHGRLHPGNVLLLPDGRVKITDLATSAALPDHGVPAQRTGDPDGPAADVRDLTAVLYAMLTGRWPASATPQPSCGVPPAPIGADGRRRGQLISPRKVRAGVPTSVDELVQRVLAPSAGTEARISAAGLADALDAVLPAERSARPARRRLRRGARRGIAVVVGTVLVALLAGGGWVVGGRDVLGAMGLGSLLGDDAAPDRAEPSAAPPPPAVPIVVPPASVTDFDPAPGSGSERTAEVPNAVDGVATTVWRTERYRSNAFGGLKAGVGLLVDLQAPTAVASLEVSTLAGTRVELRASDARGATAPDYRLLTEGTATGPTLTLTPPAGSTARWYLLWITDLPPVDGGFASQIGELSLLRG
jgi:hypothetical protein